MTYSRALITGGAGFIGSHIAKRLVDAGKEVVILDNLSVGKKENVPAGCELVNADITKPAEIKSAFNGVDVVFHDAAFVSIRGSFSKIWDDLNVNCAGTLNVFEAAAKAGVRKIVFASSMAVYGEPKKPVVKESDPAVPISPYGLSKLRGEMYARMFSQEYGMKNTCLRYFNTYGTGQTPSPYVGVLTIFIKNALSGKPLVVFGDGEQTRDFVWVEDIAKANILAAETSESGPFNIGSGKRASVNGLAAMVAKEIPGTKTERGPEPPGEIRHIQADISLAKEKLGYEPEGKLKKIVPEIVDWWRERA